MRGEHSRRPASRGELSGSSPHARGTLECRLSGRSTCGIIPACAGNTDGRTQRTARARDHPRMRGEHSVQIDRDNVIRGSSPHARGTLCVCCFFWGGLGIIPACAGNTTSTRQRLIRRRDHPRMRGEHLSMSLMDVLRMGSSPHARGTLKTTIFHYRTAGIIPACAGNTNWRRCNYHHFRDHPRMRGEHLDVNLDNISVPGSSPHARGTLVCCGDHASAGGIIPACAGNTDRTVRMRRKPRDHPRMRGEHAVSAVTCVTSWGSSPHARGTRQFDHREKGTPGIIPACAGNTMIIMCRVQINRDHPRMRGEHHSLPPICGCE